MLIGRERVHACAVGRQQTRTSAVQNRLYAEQNLVRAVRITTDVLVFLVVNPVAVNVLTNLVKRILIGLCQLFALKVVQSIVACILGVDVGITVLIEIQTARAGSIE